MITAERINELFDYNAQSGNFVRKVVRGGQPIGSVAGTKDSYGYLQFAVDGRLYLAHRMAWLVTHGEMPDCEIDHINHDRADNRIDNLRLATRMANMHNLKAARSDSKTGIAGIALKKHGYVARIQNAGKRVYLGCFKTLEEANAAYLSAKAVRMEVTA